MKTEFQEPKAQTETWALKEAAWNEVAQLPLADAWKERRRIANETVRRLKLTALVARPGRVREAEGKDRAA